MNYSGNLLFSEYIIVHKINFFLKTSLLHFLLECEGSVMFAIHYMLSTMQGEGSIAQLYIKYLPERYENMWNSFHWHRSYPITLELHPVIMGPLLSGEDLPWGQYAAFAFQEPSIDFRGYFLKYLIVLYSIFFKVQLAAWWYWAKWLSCEKK